MTFGPGLAYFACAPGMGSIWSGIPNDLTDKVTKAYDTPNQVALGANNAWFVMWPDGYYSWKFYGGYSSLDKILDAAEPRSIAVSPNIISSGLASRHRGMQYFDKMALILLTASCTKPLLQPAILCCLQRSHGQIQPLTRMDAANARSLCGVAG